MSTPTDNKHTDPESTELLKSDINAGCTEGDYTISDRKTPPYLTNDLVNTITFTKTQPYPSDDLVKMLTTQAREEFLALGSVYGYFNPSPEYTLKGIDPISILAKGKIMMACIYLGRMDSSSVFEDHFVYAKDTSLRLRSLLDMPMAFPASTSTAMDPKTNTLVTVIDPLETGLFWSNKPVDISMCYQTNKLVPDITLTFVNGISFKCVPNDLKGSAEILYNATLSLAKHLENNYKYYGLSSHLTGTSAVAHDNTVAMYRYINEQTEVEFVDTLLRLLDCNPKGCLSVCNEHGFEEVFYNKETGTGVLSFEEMDIEITLITYGTLDTTLVTIKRHSEKETLFEIKLHKDKEYKKTNNLVHNPGITCIQRTVIEKMKTITLPQSTTPT